MDDFFLPPSLRTKERYSEKGGNIHYERFLEEVISHINDPKPFSYGVFDCSRLDITHSVSIPPAQRYPVRIAEGTYSCHSLYRDAYDVRILLDISPRLQKERIIKRNGEEMWRMFRDKWIPLEEGYFEKD